MSRETRGLHYEPWFRQSCVALVHRNAQIVSFGDAVGREVTHDVSPFQALTWSLGAFASGRMWNTLEHGRVPEMHGLYMRAVSNTVHIPSACKRKVGWSMVQNKLFPISVGLDEQ